MRCFLGGALSGGAFPPSGLVDRTPEEIFIARELSAQLNMEGAWYRLCNQCSARMDGWLDVCENHESDGVCSACGRNDQFMGRFRCTVCKNHHVISPRILALYHPRLTTAAHEQGLYREDGQYDLETNEAFSDLAKSASEKLVAEEPPRVQVTFDFAGDELGTTFDDGLNVVELSN